MKIYSINPEQDIVDIADAIRAKNGTNNVYSVKEMPAAITALGGDVLTLDIDDELSSVSENPVQNKVINSAIERLNTALSGKTDIIFVSSTDGYTAGTTPLETGRVAIVYEAAAASN